MSFQSPLNAGARLVKRLKVDVTEVRCMQEERKASLAWELTGLRQTQPSKVKLEAGVLESARMRVWGTGYRRSAWSCCQ